MAKSTGIVLTATAVAFTNEWLQDGTPNIRIPVAGLAVALIFDGIERVNERAGVGLAYIMLISALLAPINGKPPAQTLLDFSNAKSGNVQDSRKAKVKR